VGETRIEKYPVVPEDTYFIKLVAFEEYVLDCNIMSVPRVGNDTIRIFA